MQFPLLHTERLSLIEIKQDHLNDLFQIFSNPEVTRFYNLLPFKEPKDAQKFIDWYQSRFTEGLAIRWGIALKGEQSIIGTIGFNNYTKHHRANIGYDLQKEYWNNGYITEALKAIISYGFKELEINRIEAEVMSGNESSEKALHKMNFTKEGVLREWMFWNSKYYDMIMYSLLKRET
ncbi:ribosomal-protein-alanine N-acetyltransferase [Dysgonomonas alginatilytica]|uniref:Ribosomal-protein-alanine N-acetyltransferase n=1 Tax=Dysgonomonas alginatilytica TaxID=1605892 RepID=A0A2V3PKN4_9BACT|nr:GNAT family protein [Dysgonomonas alginatilytica]PXV62059.1 ribosomal-protein-alanine N-acetyltransferase [Dysgonomonas alginatilytica]